MLGLYSQKMTGPFQTTRKIQSAASVLLLVGLFVAFTPQKVDANSPSLGVIRGVVQDNSGRPISGAVITVFKEGAQRALKHIPTDSDGTFSSRFLPGTYSLVAVATGFSTSSSNSVRVSRAEEVVYRFNLEPLGSGKTISERRRDRSDSKWAIRAAQNRRSIFQLTEDIEIAVGDTEQIQSERFHGLFGSMPGSIRRKGSVLEISGGGLTSGGIGNINFATLYGLSEQGDVLFTGQYSKGAIIQSRFETTFRTDHSDRHSTTIKTGFFQSSGLGLNSVGINQFNVSLTDEQKVSEDLVLIFGFDYSKLSGLSRRQFFSPRFGVKYDLNENTRLRAGIYSVSLDESGWEKSVELDGNPINLITLDQSGSAAQSALAPQRSNRFDFGIEGMVDRQSTLEGTVFLDFTGERKISFLGLPIDSGQSHEITASHPGDSLGARLVYSRRLSSGLQLSGGYSLGIAPTVTSIVLDGSGDLEVDNRSFHSVFAQMSADVGPDTNLRTIVRFSPKATIFAVDPFLGSITIYDPGVSFVLTRILPNMGLPIKAEASIAARNVFDQSTEALRDETRVRFASHRRMFRGGILVRF